MKSTSFVLAGFAALIVAPDALAQDCIETIWTADLESYVDGENIITGQACYPECPAGLRWEAWESEPEGAGSHAEAAFGNPGLSIDLRGTRPLGTDNLVHTFHDLDLGWPGVYLFAADLYVPAGSGGRSYYMLLNSYTNDGSSHTEGWSTQIQIDADERHLESDFDAGTVPLQFDVWRRLETIINLNDDEQESRYDGDRINAGFKCWVPCLGHGANTLAALALYGDDADPVYWDNFRLCTISAEGACCFRSDPCVDGIVRDDCEALQDDAIFQGIGSSCGACPFYGADGWEVDDLLTVAPPFTWEGDTCNDFPGIPSNPDCEFFPQDCSECDLSDSQDQAWSFQIPWSGTWTFSTCGAADFDTWISAGTATCQNDIGSNDDCVRIPNEDDSELAVALSATDRVAITLEGFGTGDCGLYTLSVGAPCPEIAIGVDEEVLGPCADNDTDPENIGCNADPDDPLSIATFTDVACGQTFAGTVGNFVFQGGAARDFDWFRLDVATTSRVVLDAVGNYPQVVLYLADLNADPGAGEDECTDAGIILVADETPTCTDADGERAAARVSACVGPGRYAPVVTTAFVDPSLPVELGGVPCGSPYELTVTCLAPADLNGDGAVTFADIVIVLSNWGGPGSDGDANCDGVVDLRDLLEVLVNWT